MIKFGRLIYKNDIAHPIRTTASTLEALSFEIVVWFCPNNFRTTLLISSSFTASLSVVQQRAERS